MNAKCNVYGHSIVYIDRVKSIYNFLICLVQEELTVVDFSNMM